MRRIVLCASLAIVATACTPPPISPGGRTAVDQGPNWNTATRAAFYTTDQGSQIMPVRWMKALKTPDGQPFLVNNMTRYGYLANDTDPTTILPVGFTSAGPHGSEQIGMTCAACHTRQIEVAGIPYRIDGGPAIADFQTMLSDLDTAVNTVINDPAAFQSFAASVLDPPVTPAQQAQLMADLKAWFLRYDTLIKRALPTTPWGPSRLDAVSMIFDRLTGLDIGPAPSYLIPANIQPADAPVRYPFLWNAAIQDRTQWPGFADNGNDILGLARNLGEVYGVFATFHPVPDASHPVLKYTYYDKDQPQNYSANFDGLWALEDLIKRIGPPKFPFPIDAALAAKGEAIYKRDAPGGSCESCHGITPGKTQPIDQKTWATPLVDVGTDSREYSILGRTVDTGALNGATIPGIFPPLKPTDTAFNTLSTSVVGSILQKIFPFTVPATMSAAAPSAKTTKAAATQLASTTEAQELQGAFHTPATTTFKYESRVMEGIWAAAPYLHNGSVPTLADLLKPVPQRPASFQIGPAYDPATVGLASVQTKFNYTLVTTDCTDRNSGNSRCGHEFGTNLTPDEKRALLEYMKQL